MNSDTQLAFELAIIKLFNLPKHIIWCTLHFEANKSPTVECAYEVWGIDDNPLIVDGIIKTIQKKFVVFIKEIEE